MGNLKCYYCSEAKENIRDYFFDPQTNNAFCNTGCRDMWYCENGNENLSVRMGEKGIERLINGNQIIDLNGK